jgi:hypothetical protein
MLIIGIETNDGFYTYRNITLHTEHETMSWGFLQIYLRVWIDVLRRLCF